jgi:hypothetical protein
VDQEHDISSATVSDVAVPDRLPLLDRGSHMPHRSKVCAMEAASWLAGEEWSDHPRSVHRVIAQAARVANDCLTDTERQALWPLVLASIGTGTGWRPVLWWRLARHEMQMQRSYQGDPKRVWEEVLKEHSRLTGHRARPVPASRVGALEEELGRAESTVIA